MIIISTMSRKLIISWDLIDNFFNKLNKSLPCSNGEIIFKLQYTFFCQIIYPVNLFMSIVFIKRKKSVFQADITYGFLFNDLWILLRYLLEYRKKQTSENTTAPPKSYGTAY